MTATPSQHPRARLASLAIAVIAVLVAGVLSVTLAGADASKHPKTHRSSTVSATSKNPKPAKVTHPEVWVRGVTSGALAPGTTDPVTIYVHNPSRQKETVTSVTITARNASATCTAARNIRVTGYHRTAKSRRYVIQAHHRVLVPLTIRMLDLHDSGTPGSPGFTSGNQDACQGKSFPLTFHATARVG